MGQVRGQATRAVMRREFEVSGNAPFERLAGISTRPPAQPGPASASASFTRPRSRPHPERRPGFVRVDSVHQGDLDGSKGVYETRMVDEVTRYEFVGAVEAISVRFLIPVPGDCWHRPLSSS